MRSRVRQVLPELKRLNRLAAKDRQRYLKTCGGPFVDCVCECIRNLLKGRVPLRPKQVKALCRYRRLLRQAASKKTPGKNVGGYYRRADYIGTILPSIISGLGAIISPLVSRMVNSNGTR
jgi:hypothetical protein